MQTKAYFASSVPAALEVARQEMGENALLVSSRPAPPRARQFGRLEVTFAWDPAERPPTDRSPVARRLETAGFSLEIAKDIAAGAARRSGNPDIAFADELTSRIPVAPFVEMKSGEQRKLAFVGPPGRGKTISLVKLAVQMGLARRVPVRICCAGAHAVGAQEQLARLAGILGVPFQSCESRASLSLALDGESGQGLVLIDTPGISPADRSELAELQEFFAARAEIEKHLVLRSDASSADMLHTVSRFSGLRPSRLLFTGMDEAIRVTPVIETLMRTGIPATFAGTGQRIPEDLEEVNAGRLARAVWASAGHEEFAQTAAA